MDSLKSMCVRELVDQINVDNLHAMVGLGVKYKSEQLKRRALKFLWDNWDELAGKEVMRKVMVQFPDEVSLARRQAVPSSTSVYGE